MINPVVYSISLDIYKIGSQKVLSMVRGDTKRAIVIHLTENERPYSINEGCTAYFTAKKPDGNFIYNECEVDFKSNTITYNVTEQTTAVNGKVDCQLRLVGANGGIVSTPSFSLVVADLLYNEEPIVESSREFNALTSYIADLKNRVENGEFNGKSIYIKGSVSDPGELDEKITSSVAGDGYLADDNHLYVFDGTVFVDVGLVRGPRGLSGVHFGSGDMPEDCNVQIDPTGSAVTVVDEVIKDSKELVTSGAVERCVSEIESALERNEELSNTNKSTIDGHTQLLDEHAGQLGEHAELLGEHTDLINGKLSVYKSLTAIGLTAGSETIEDIALALPNRSMLFYAAGTAANADTYPEITPFAEIVVFKEDISRVIFQYISKTTARVWVGVYSNTNTNGYWTGWKKIATTDDKKPIVLWNGAARMRENIVVSGLSNYNFAVFAFSKTDTEGEEEWNTVPIYCVNGVSNVGESLKHWRADFARIAYNNDAGEWLYTQERCFFSGMYSSVDGYLNISQQTAYDSEGGRSTLYLRKIIGIM